MDNHRIAKELLGIAKGLSAAMPRGHERGALKRTLGRILRKNDWEKPSIFESRNGSGFEIHAWRDVEQLPDVSFDSNARTNDDLQREFAKEEKELARTLSRSVKPKPEEIVVNVRLNRSHQGTRAKLYIYLKYDVGFPVTPIEFL